MRKIIPTLISLSALAGCNTFLKIFNCPNIPHSNESWLEEQTYQTVFLEFIKQEDQIQFYGGYPRLESPFLNEEHSGRYTIVTRDSNNRALYSDSFDFEEPLTTLAIPRYYKQKTAEVYDNKTCEKISEINLERYNTDL